MPSCRSISIPFLLLLIHAASSETDDVKLSLISFLRKLSPNNSNIDQDLGWRSSSDPCVGGWHRVTCNDRTKSVQKIKLDGLGLTGSIDVSLLCKARLTFVSLRNNALQGELMPEISNCTQLTHLLISGNRLSAGLPSSLARLKNLKRLDISYNNFSGEVPQDLSKTSGLVTFLAQNNRLNGSIPPFDFTNLQQFNVSDNLFTGGIPDGGDRFAVSTFASNAGLCGKPLNITCPPSPSTESKSKSFPREKVAMLSGYIVLGLAFLLFLVHKKIFRRNRSESRRDEEKQSVSSVKPVNESSGNTTGESRPEFSIPSSSAGALLASSLVVLNNPGSRRLRFEDLLRAPAELLGRGRFGTLYKVMFDDGTVLVVKRIKDWTISREEFQMRLERIDQVKHPSMLQAVAFHSSKQEKLVIYEYQQNGSLFKLLHDSHGGQLFDWIGRLSVAAATAKCLAFMHQELQEEGISHGNLKSTNILMDSNMDPCISEYGLVAMDPQTLQPSTKGTFSADVYSLGVILLELLTGKLVQSNGPELARWVHSVVREEWTAEVFDKGLISEGASEERMVYLLQVALKCMNPSSDARPSMIEVATLIGAIKEEEEERSVVSEA